MQDSETIEITKKVPSDQLTVQVLISWYQIAKPKWIKPLNVAAMIFFALLSVAGFLMSPIPIHAWFALVGLMVTLLLPFYVTVIARNALKANKQNPLYDKDKLYVFGENDLTFSCEGIDPIVIPFERFTELGRTKQALLFLFGKKLVLWLPLNQLTNEQTESIIRRFQAHGVAVKEW